MADSRRQQPEQQAPPVQRLRLRYWKSGPARFTSTRDFSRAFERALRRAGVPMAYSSGFSPHPRISYANAAPTGAATRAEYVELGLARVVDPEQLRAALDAALPPGMGVDRVAEAVPPSLSDRLDVSLWRVELAGVEAVLAPAVERFLAAERVEVQRMTKSGLRTFDARAAVVRLTCAGPQTLELLSRQGTPLVRPDDVVRGLSTLTPDLAPTAPPLLERLAQGPLTGDGEVGDPLAG